MSTNKRILVAVDFSERSDAVLRFALQLASHLGAEVTVMHAWHAWHDYVEPSGYRERVAPRLERELEKLIGRIGAEGVATKVALEEGRPAEAIVGLASRWDYDLIVVGSHGEHQTPRYLIGTVTERVVRTSPVPVIIVPTAGKSG